ncbi:hypothetical protein BOX15_Mlig020213g1, partial [Macrostomum lignano]
NSRPAMAAPQGTELGLFIAASSGGVQLNSEAMADLALNLLRTVPQARLAVLEHFSSVFNDYVCNSALHAKSTQCEPVRKTLANHISRLCSALDQLMPTAPTGFASDVCRWSLDLLASLCLKYAPHVIGEAHQIQRSRDAADRQPMEERTRQWLSVPGIPELLGIAQRFGERDDFSDGLLAGQPQLDWLLAAPAATVGLCGRRSASASAAVLDRLLDRAMRDSSTRDGSGRVPPSLLDLLAHLAVNRRGELCAALRRLCRKAESDRRQLASFLLHLAAFGSAGLSGLLVELAVRFASANPEQLAGALDAMLSDNPDAVVDAAERRQMAASVLLRCQEPSGLRMLRLLLQAVRRRPNAGQSKTCALLLASVSSSALRSLPGSLQPGQQEPQQALLRLTDRLTARCPYSARLLAAAAVAGGRPGCLQRLLRPALTGHPKLLLQALDVIELHDSDAADAIADCLLQRLLSAADWRLRRHLLRSAGALLAEEASQERRRLAGALGRQLPRLLRLLDAGPGPAGVADLLALTGRLEFHRSAPLADCIAATGALSRAVVHCLLESPADETVGQVGSLADQLADQLLGAARLYPHCRVAAIRQLVQAMLSPSPPPPPPPSASVVAVDSPSTGSVALITSRPPSVDVAGQLLRRRAPLANRSAAADAASSMSMTSAAEMRWSAEQDLLALLHRLVMDGDAAKCGGSGGSQAAARALAVALSQAACPEGALLAMAATLDKVGLESGTRVLSQFRARPVALWGALELAARLGEPCVLAEAAPLLAALLTGLTVHWGSRRQQPQSSACAGAAAETRRLIGLLRAGRLLSPPLDRLDAIVDCLTPAELHPLLEELRRAVLEAADWARREGPQAVAKAGLVSAERAAPLLNRLLHRHVTRLAPLFGEFFSPGGGLACH